MGIRGFAQKLRHFQIHTSTFTPELNTKDTEG